MIVWFGAPLAALLTTTSSRPNCSTARSTKPSALHDVTGVGRHRERAAPTASSSLHHLVEVVAPPRRDHDVATLPRQRERGSTDRSPARPR